MKKVLAVFGIIAFLTAANIAAYAMCLPGYTQCGYIGGRVGMDRCCKMGCCGPNRDRCCEDEARPSPRPQPMPQPQPQPSPTPPFTGWATLTMQNDSGESLSLHVDNGGAACPGFIPICTTQVKVGYHTFSAKNSAGETKDAGSYFFKPGDSYTFKVRFSGPPKPIFRPPDEVFPTAKITIDNRTAEDIYFYVDNEPKGKIEALEEREFTVKAGPRHLKVTNHRGRKIEKDFNFKKDDAKEWTISPK